MTADRPTDRPDLPRRAAAEALGGAALGALAYQLVRGASTASGQAEEPPAWIKGGPSALAVSEVERERG